MLASSPHRVRSAALTALLTLSPAAAALAAEASPDGLWSDLPALDEAALGAPETATVRHRAVLLEPGALDALLAAAPAEGSAAALAGEPVVMTLPLPDGGFGRFRVEESPIMAPGLAAKFSEISTYRGFGIDEPAATVRFSITPHGFHAQVLSPHGRFFVDPHTRRDRRHHLVYFARDARRPEGVEFRCDVHGALAPPAETSAAAGPTPVDLRTYRTAVAATGEYTAFHSSPDPPDVPHGMAAIVIAMNRVNGIYEQDVAIRMVLVADNDQVVYTNGATDPYNNNSGGAMLSQNQTNLDLVIGDADYDIGHVFSTGGGGVASLGVPCRSGLKARGVTGLPSPIGDVFYVDYVAHEMGHQWGANHSFNGNGGSCAGGNRNAATAYEPGSGSTIMAYAGICGSQNLQPNSDDHFHAISLAEIVNYSRGGLGNGCAATVAVGNTPPEADAGPSFIAPTGTPFTLCGAGTDADDDPLTFNWEQWDLGPAGHPNSPSGNAPIFRSFPSTQRPDRTFPRWNDILGNTQTIGEILPSYARTLNLRLTVRDTGQVGGAFGTGLTQVMVDGGSGPFVVTAPNTGGVVWPAGSQQTVTWDPAGTSGPPVDCATVGILLSVDGGATFPVGLGGAVPNTGAAQVTVPPMTTAAARVMVHCASPGTSFFDVGNSDFTISGAGELLFASNFESCGGGFDEWSEVVVE
jgi:hypothetical protein